MIELHCRPDGARPTVARIAAGLADSVPALCAAHFPGRAVHALVDARIAEIHPKLLDALPRALPVEGGEGLKSFAGLERTIRHLLRSGIDRRGVVLAIGGGTVGDLGGLAASLCMRGIEFALVPTTLLSMVDSSVGGKTAINVPEGKNLVGTFWPASEVWIDPTLAATLPEPEWRSGLGEVLKIAIGLDAELFEACERDPDALLERQPDAVAHAVERALRAKIRVVEADPTERGLRRLLNLGHTIGHALEAWSGFTIPHGIAVARGLHHAIAVAARRRELSPPDAARCGDLLRRFGFDADPLPPAAALAPFLAHDKKLDSGTLHAVLPTAIGESRTVAVDPTSFLGS